MSSLPVNREELYQRLFIESSNTPLIEIEHPYLSNENRLFVKLEYRNVVGSMHLRVYPHVFKNAESFGFILPYNTPVIEASFGNAGAAFAYCANILGYNHPSPPTVVVPSNISSNRLKKLLELGAHLIYSPGERFNIGYVEQLNSELLADRNKRSCTSRIDISRLYPVTKTRKNARAPYKNLVDEASKQMLHNGVSQIDYFVGIIGSGTSISGIGDRLKELNPSTRVVASESTSFRNSSSLISTGLPLPISTVPENYPYIAAIGVPLDKLNLNKSLIDEVVQFNLEDINPTAKSIYSRYGLNFGHTTIASILGVFEISKGVQGKNFLICAYDEAVNWS